jgi:hypothetical protein
VPQLDEPDRDLGNYDGMYNNINKPLLYHVNPIRCGVDGPVVHESLAENWYVAGVYVDGVLSKCR